MSSIGVAHPRRGMYQLTGCLSISAVVCLLSQDVLPCMSAKVDWLARKSYRYAARIWTGLRAPSAKLEPHAHSIYCIRL